jgi:hypothetical protein
MNVEFESFEFDGKKKRVLTEEEARKAFIRKHLPPMSWKQRYGALMEAFELSCQSRQRWALRMKATLAANDLSFSKNRSDGKPCFIKALGNEMNHVKIPADNHVTPALRAPASGVPVLEDRSLSIWERGS